MTDQSGKIDPIGEAAMVLAEERMAEGKIEKALKWAHYCYDPLLTPTDPWERSIVASIRVLAAEVRRLRDVLKDCWCNGVPSADQWLRHAEEQIKLRHQGYLDMKAKAEQAKAETRRLREELKCEKFDRKSFREQWAAAVSAGAQEKVIHLKRCEAFHKEKRELEQALAECKKKLEAAVKALEPFAEWAGSKPNTSGDELYIYYDARGRHLFSYSYCVAAKAALEDGA